MRRLLAIFCLLLTPIFSLAAPTPAQVLVVANGDSADSMAIARYYMAARGIPPKNLIELSTSHNEEIAWPLFVSQIWNPLLKKLMEDGWLEGELKGASDRTGRHRLVVRENKIGYLVICRGVPLRIGHNAAALAVEALPDVKPEFALTTASVDSELTLLAETDTPVTAVIINPFFNKKDVPPESLKRLVRVARLDGPTRQDCERLVDSALLGEKLGLPGRAYIDCGGPHAQGDDWLRQTAALLQETGYDLTLENTPALFGPEQRFDAPVFYFGWYSQNIAGRLADPDFLFPPGAIALHIHSFSARTLRSGTQGWAGPLVRRGAALTVGNVAEPYLQLTTVPPLLASGLLQGMQAGQAYIFATPALSWQSILLGDPLYQPFKNPIEKQLETAITNNNPRALYALLRQANLLNKAGKTQEAVTLLERGAAQLPVLPLCYALAQNQVALGQPIKLPGKPVSLADDDTGLVIEAARFFQKHAQQELAETLYAKALAASGLSEALRAKLLVESGKASPPGPETTPPAATAPPAPAQ